MRISAQLLFAGALLLVATHSASAQTLGPVDEHKLPPKALDRVKVGELPPDFRLAAHTGEIFQLSTARDTHDVVLLFYRGHW